jgi:membrane fusion protein, copper/silver efflux system
MVGLETRPTLRFLASFRHVMNHVDPTSPTPAPRPAPTRLASRAAAIALARFRFIFLVGVVLLVVGFWPTLQNWWDKLTGPPPTPGGISGDTEYWCPMCPGVVSDWPGKCPVCSMTLVRRTKGDMTPLPDGVVARVQLSPYRVQLAGIRTSPVEYRRLEREVIVGGLLEAPGALGGDLSRVFLNGEVLQRDAPLLTRDAEAHVLCDDVPGEKFVGRIVDLQPNPSPQLRGFRIRIQVDDPRRELRPNSYAAAHFRGMASRLESVQRLAIEQWRDRTAAQLFAATLGSPAGFGADAALPALLDAGVQQALMRNGLVLAVPESSVIDTGARKIVYLEQMHGTFDAVEIRVGRRCGDFYPIISGLEPGQRVVTAGAVLLDAESRLNPSVAAGYFGAGSRPPVPTAPPPPTAPGSLSPEDRLLAERQRVCPVTKKPLDSMGGPVRVVVNGRVVFLCCDGCEDSLREQPEKYLPR